MGAPVLNRLATAVERLLQRNSQLQALCEQLLAEQEDWRRQRQEMLAEVDGLLADLEQLRERQT